MTKLELITSYLMVDKKIIRKIEFNDDYCKIYTNIGKIYTIDKFPLMLFKLKLIADKLKQ
jgi:hypothetical protein